MKSKNRVKNWVIILIILLSVGCDQITKYIVRENLEYNTQINVIGHYVTLTKVENTGAFLGLGSSIPRPLYNVLMIALPLIAIGYGLYYLMRKNTLSKVMTIGLSFAMGGGLGNIYDRILYGSVTDFLYFDFIIFHTGIVNVADISVTFGFFLLLYGMYFDRKESKVIE